MFTVERLKRGKEAADAASTIDHPLQHLVACHARIEERLAILERAAEYLDTKPEEAQQALESVFRYFETSAVMHTADEEESVFPRLAARLNDEDREYVAALEEQHRKADELYVHLKHGPQGDLAEFRVVVTRFCRLYREHIASENERLIGVGRRLLTRAELESISAEMKRRRGLR
jgi:hemerythrin-like domain-containing protein